MSNSIYVKTGYIALYFYRSSMYEISYTKFCMVAGGKNEILIFYGRPPHRRLL